MCEAILKIKHTNHQSNVVTIFKIVLGLDDKLTFVKMLN